ncbi:WXG100 family type VII secretion target [Tamaricihabitans halophyticus]|uniref:WXG100 family type VII secretion target n=1 Tax=Tamaricihabitans halophyticus TaxID=1262583 RepID=A0A4R2QWS3_9PSEU|nr:WXG100 family type VII secretion target [Tamaricihabitans halophyticus]TCP53589.1 WXG100 family type VII secretion target [Tamaricihabitans halophyticus]
MFDRIKYLPGAVSETGSNTTQLSQQMTALYETLQGKAKSICGDAWQGSASEAFQDREGKWQAAAAEFASAEARCGRATEESAQNAHATDIQCAGLFG